VDSDSITFAGGIHNADSFEVPAARYDIDADLWEVLDEDPIHSRWPVAVGDTVGISPEVTSLRHNGEDVEIPVLPTPSQTGVATHTGDALVVLGGEVAQDMPGDLAFILDLDR
jgi:hypothetical protein